MDTKHSSTADGGKSNPTRLPQRQREKRINLVESSDGGVEMLDDSSVASNNTAETDNAAEGDAAEKNTRRLPRKPVLIQAGARARGLAGDAKGLVISFQPLGSRIDGYILCCSSDFQIGPVS